MKKKKRRWDQATSEDTPAKKKWDQSETPSNTHWDETPGRSKTGGETPGTLRGSETPGATPGTLRGEETPGRTPGATPSARMWEATPSYLPAGAATPGSATPGGTTPSAASRGMLLYIIVIYVTLRKFDISARCLGDLLQTNPYISMLSLRVLWS